MSTEDQPRLDSSHPSPWRSPPRLRTAELAGDRHATWLELFFDLVFVVAVAQLSTGLDHDSSAAGYFRFAAVFLTVAWAWMGFTFYANRFDTDDVVYRVMKILGMLGIAALAVNAQQAIGSRSVAFALSYVAMRIVLVALYVRAYRALAEARRSAGIYIGGFSIGIALWLGSLLLPPPWRYGVWAVALLVELGTPLLGWRALSRLAAPVDTGHLAERFGLFTVIVLGESVAALVSGTSNARWALDTGLVAAAGFGIPVCLWWIYFDFVDVSVIRRGLLGLVYMYSHLALFCSVTAVGAGVRMAIEHAPSAHLPAGTRWALCGGVALFLLSISAFHAGTSTAERLGVVPVRLGLAGLVVGLGFLGALLPPLVLVAVLVTLLGVGLVIEATACRRSLPDHEEMETVVLPGSLSAREREPVG